MVSNPSRILLLFGCEDEETYPDHGLNTRVLIGLPMLFLESRWGTKGGKYLVLLLVLAIRFGLGLGLAFIVGFLLWTLTKFMMSSRE